jgi:integrator complex subunit 2
LAAREIQCIICSFLHQMFIDNSNLAELVHFQGYPKQLIPILVRGVPSMHICIDFVPKLLSHNDLNKQVSLVKKNKEYINKYIKY